MSPLYVTSQFMVYNRCCQLQQSEYNTFVFSYVQSAIKAPRAAGTIWLQQGTCTTVAETGCILSVIIHMLPQYLDDLLNAIFKYYFSAFAVTIVACVNYY